MLKNMKLSKKIGVGFAAITVVLAATVLIARNGAGESATISTRVIELRNPTLQNTLLMQSGMNRSLAALRGWIILGKDKFKDERQFAWKSEIDTAVAEMELLSQKWTDPENLHRLTRIKESLAKFKSYQKEIEDIAQTVENTPASKILFIEAAPKATIMAAKITEIINLEGQLEATQARKDLLGMMADVRGTLGLGLGSIRAYLLSGDEKFKKSFDKLWAKNTRRFGDLSKNAGLLSSAQAKAFAEFSAARAEFISLPPKMFAIRGGDEWNLANRWLGTKAAPTAASIVKDIQGMLDSQGVLAKKDAAAATAQISSLQTLMWILLFVGVALSVIVGTLITRMITRPIIALTEVAQSVALGQVDCSFDYDSNDEIGQLGDAFTQVADGQRDLAQVACSLSAGDLDVDVQLRSPQDRLGQSMVTMRDSLKAVLADVGELTTAAVDGRLSTRADARKHKGEYANIVQGVNSTLDAVLHPITEAQECLAKLANYDLQARMSGNYRGDHGQIKESINQMANVLNDTLSQVAEAAEQASSASSQIASGSQSIAQGASEQASSLEETSSSLEEMTGMTKQTADNTRQANSLAISTRDAAHTGNDAMQNLTTAMSKIHTSAEGTAQIIGDINEIAFQTNLLALNAAVEAARAGDAGRGFAVVAEEVRNLALRSKDAAKKTEDLIKESVDLAREGGTISNQVSSALDGIVDSIGKVADIVSEISVASEEQARGIDQVNRAVAEMDKVVQQAAASSEETSSAAEELSSQSQELAAMVGRFDLGARSRGSSYTAPAPRRAVAAAPPAPRAKAPAAPAANDHMIPFDDDDGDFADF